MPDERDVATATRPALDPAYNAQTAQVPARIEQQQASTAHVAQLEGRAMIFSREEIELLKRTIAKDATDDELNLFLYQCKRTRLDPMTRQCYFMRRSAYDKKQERYVDSFTFETSIDGFRLIAERTDKYAGQIAPQWADVRVPTDGGPPVIRWYEVWPFAERTPYAARVGVCRKDFDAPLYAVARWDAYVQLVDVWEGKRKTGEKRLNAMWEKRGAEQLAKCAEALALRQAFPNELSGVYSSEEMGQADNDDDETRRELEHRQERRDGVEKTRRGKGARQEQQRTQAAQPRPEPVTIYAGLTVSRYKTRFPFGKEPIKGAGLDENELTSDRKHAIEREYIVKGDLLARAWDWCEKALAGHQTTDEVDAAGKKTGKKLPVVLDEASIARFKALQQDLADEMERRQIERDEHKLRTEATARAADLPAADAIVADGVSAVDEDSAAIEDAELVDEDRGEAYEGD